jgi:hypothetical protein
MADYAHQIRKQSVLMLEKEVNRSRRDGMRYFNRVEEDFVNRVKDKVAYNIQRYLRPNPSPSKSIVLRQPYVERYAVHRILNDGKVSMMVGEFIFREEAEEYVKNAMLGRMVFGGRAFNLTDTGIATIGNLGVVGGSADRKGGAVVGTKTMADGSTLMVQVR